MLTSWSAISESARRGADDSSRCTASRQLLRSHQRKHGQCVDARALRIAVQISDELVSFVSNGRCITHDTIAAM
jgi:hypothetical protein